MTDEEKALHMEEFKVHMKAAYQNGFIDGYKRGFNATYIIEMISTFEKLKDSYYSLKKAWAEGSEQRGLIEYQNYLIEYLQNFEVDLYKLEEKIKENDYERF